MGDSRRPTPGHRLNAYCAVIVRVSYGYGYTRGSGRIWVKIFGTGRVRVQVASSATGTGRVAEMVVPHTPCGGQWPPHNILYLVASGHHVISGGHQIRNICCTGTSGAPYFLLVESTGIIYGNPTGLLVCHYLPRAVKYHAGAGCIDTFNMPMIFSMVWIFPCHLFIHVCKM